MPTQIIIEGIDQLIEKYGAARFERAVKAASLATAHEIANELKVYPPATAANSPGRWRETEYGQVPMGYYERNRGWWSPVMQKATLYTRGGDNKNVPGLGKSAGAIAAKRGNLQQIAGYKLTSFSENLGKRWQVFQEGLGAVVVNAVTYAPYVQSARAQSQTMERIGWRTDEAAIQTVVRRGTFGDAFKRAFAGRK